MMDTGDLMRTLGAIESSLERIEEQVKLTNGNVQIHARWIAAREEVCKTACDRLQMIETDLRAADNYITLQRGGIRVVNMLWAALLVIAGGVVATLIDHLWFKHR